MTRERQRLLEHIDFEWVLREGQFFLDCQHNSCVAVIVECASLYATFVLRLTSPRLVLFHSIHISRLQRKMETECQGTAMLCC
jgi:hypothetical protein